MPRFSVVVPIFNTGAYLEACLESLRGQSFADWQAVLVNDGSTDASATICRRYCQMDDRFLLLDLPTNRGRHGARIAGTAVVSGEYVLYLDSDDTYDLDFLARLHEALGESRVDALHFGQRVIPVDGTSEEAGRAFEDNEQQGYPLLRGSRILTTVFAPEEGFRRDWMVTNRAFRQEVAKRAFAAMTPSRLNRGEDGYEYFVLAAFEKTEATRNDIVGYNYYMGRGIINSRPLSSDAFLQELSDLQSCIEATWSFARSRGGKTFRACAAGAQIKLHELGMNDWHRRVSPEDKTSTAEQGARIIGGAQMATNLFRLARDEAYEIWVNGGNLRPGDDVLYLRNLAYAVYAPCKEAWVEEAFRDMERSANGHIDDILGRQACQEREATLEDWNRQDIRVLVSEHKEFASFCASSLQMIQVGAALASHRIPGVLHDDTGENDSDQNRMLCEVTAQFWAWKNLSCKYIGFFHYRRYFNFSSQQFKENGWGEVMDGPIDRRAQKKYCLGEASIACAVDGWDVITSPVQDLRKMPGSFTTPYEHYASAPKLHIEDLDLCMDVLAQLHPEYVEDANAYLSGNFSCFCNMFVMRKELFDEYAEWLFPVLQQTIEAMDFSHYSVEAVRTPGHLAERLLNIWLLHQERIGRGLKRTTRQVVHFTDPDIHGSADPLTDRESGRPLIPVVFAANNAYVPMVTTAIASVLEHASTECDYDIVVLHRDITPENQAIMKEHLGSSVRFLCVGDSLDAYGLTTNNPHISLETYYRFLIQDLLPFYDKVLYLDSDLVVRGDVAKLFETDISESLLAAVRDIDYLGNLNMNDGKRLAYSRDVLGLARPYDYFQAGVLLLNTQAMREFMSMDDWLKHASDPKFIYNDQDALNACCQGHVTYLDPRWNVMTDCMGRVERVFSFAPAQVFEEYKESRRDPFVVHYAGVEKPWNVTECDMARYYWQEARGTPFYEQQLVGLSQTAPKNPFAAALQRPGAPVPEAVRNVLDPVLPIGSRRRELVKAVARAVRGER